MEDEITFLPVKTQGTSIMQVPYAVIFSKNSTLNPGSPSLVRFCMYCLLGVRRHNRLSRER